MLFRSIDPEPIDPALASFLKDRGIGMSGQTSKSVQQVPNLDHYRMIIALSSAGRKAFPPPPTKTVTLDWTLPASAGSTQGGGQSAASFEEAYRFLQTQIQDLTEALLGDDIE